MNRFKKILVGVDLSWGDRLVAQRLTPPNAEAVKQAIWLAKRNSAAIHFFAALDLSARAQHLLSQCETTEKTILDEAQQQLDACVARAKERGVDASDEVVIGRSWLELIRQVIRGQHDLLVVGTRHLGAMQGALFGSTGMKLLRKCPCALWVTQPLRDEAFDSILVAHDLRPVGDLALELGSTMAQLHDAKLHVLHAADPREVDHLPGESDSAESAEGYCREAEKRLRSNLSNADFSSPPQVHVSIERPDIAILDSIAKNQIDLVVMGTIGRTGFPGFVIGNTAERLLPKIPCSLLAVKPEDFKSPVQLTSDEFEDDLVT
ncbi:MAG: universal stress protein [Lacipirellulaceae bacterium]